ncbi:MAG: DUF4258 domain-containing protein [Planctomycetes bacterium]|nr:DUF4258 domain-containing protein [Planctomycetota bacterium]
MQDQPQWWEWELEISPHLVKRMIDRSFSELDLRTMLEHPKDRRPDTVDGRWVIGTTYRRQRWEVVVEPDLRARRLVVITAYPCWGS